MSTRRNIFVLGFMVLSCLLNKGFSQEPSIDSLLLRLKNHPTEDSIRSELVTDLAYFFRETNNLLTIKYLDEAIRLGKKYNTPGFVGGRHLDLGETYTNMGNTEKAMQSLLEAERIFKQTGNDIQVVKSYANIAILYLKLNNVPKAKEFLQKAFPYLNEQKPSFQMCVIYSSLGDAYLKEERYDSTIYYLNKIIQLAPKIRDSEYFKEAAEMNLGLVYKKQKKYQLAIEKFNQTLNNPKVMADPINEGTIRNNLACTYAEMGKLNLAKFEFDSSISIAKANGYEFLILENYKNMASMYQNAGIAHQEIIYLRKYHALNDSINSRDNQNRLNQLERDYFEEANLKLLNNQKQKSQQITLIACFTTILAFGILFFYFRSRRRSQLLLAQKREIENQNAALKQLNQTKDKLFRIIGHDLRNPLVTLSAYLNHSEKQGDETLMLKKETTKALQESIALLDNLLTWASSQLHQVSVSKKIVQLDDLIEDVCGDLKLHADMKQIDLVEKIHSVASTVITNREMLAIILRNLITNSIKFSQIGQEILIETYLEKQSLVLCITDYGLGMSSEQIEDIMQGKGESKQGTSHEKGSGLGLNIVRDLLAKLNVRWTIQSRPTMGTKWFLYFDESH